MGPVFLTLAALSVALLSGFAAAVILVRKGLAGRPTDDHPVCRACRFDLFNLPPDRAACPECGANLSAPRAVQVGNRRRRKAPFYSGLAMLLAIVLTAGVVGTRIARSTDRYRLVPDTWVERDTRAREASRQRTAWVELNRRFLQNGLSSARTARLIDVALARQADEKVAWMNEIGDFVEVVHKARALPQDKWLRYAKQAPRLSLRARPQIGRADTIVAEVIQDGDRVASNSLLLVRPVETEAGGDLVAERATPAQVKDWAGEQIGTGGFRYQPPIDTDRRAMATAAAGKHAVEVAATIEVSEGQEMDPQNARPLFRERNVLKAEFDLVNRDTAAIEIIPDDSPALRQQIESAVRVVSADALPGGRFIMVRTSDINPPVPMAFRVTVRQGRREWEGTRTCDAGVNTSGVIFIPEKDFKGDRLDVFLEPDVSIARDTVDMTRMWNGRLEFRDIPIRRPTPPATQP